jgi:glycosyltransferase involved in cell wall biosynthesis
MPFFSIILPTYNRAALLMNAIRSVIEQEFKDWELIIVDDGSNDVSRSKIEEIQDSRIRYIFQENQGKGPARNRGLDAANGDWICFLDSDDLYYPNHLAVFYQAIKAHPERKIFRSGICWETKKGKKCQPFVFKEGKQEQIEYMWKYYFPLLNVCIESSLAKAERFENYTIGQDKHYVQRLLFSTSYYQLEDHTVYIPLHPNRSVSHAYKDDRIIQSQIDCLDDSYLLYKEHFKGKALAVDIRKAKSETYLLHALQAKKKGDFNRFIKIGILGLRQFPNIKTLFKWLYILFVNGK